ncbi:hypothetical protein [Rhodococcus triatomae]
MSPISMDSTLLADAAGSYEKAHVSGQEVITRLAAALDANWGGAGSDTAGTSAHRSPNLQGRVRR